MKKFMSFCLVTIMLLCCLCGCSGTSVADETTAAEETQTSAADTTAESEESSAEEETTEEPTTEEPTTEEPTTEEPTTEEPTKAVTTYTAGTYKVGSDIPAGEYAIFATSNYGGYYAVRSDSSGDTSSIIGNDNFDYNAIVTVYSGQYLELNRAKAVPIDEAEIDTSGEGTFRVGIDIPAGEYKLTNTSSTLAYYAVYNSSDADAKIVANDNFDGSTYITVTSGQYLLINRCEITN